MWDLAALVLGALAPELLWSDGVSLGRLRRLDLSVPEICSSLRQYSEAVSILQILCQWLLVLPCCPIAMLSHPDSLFDPSALCFFLSFSLLFASVIPHLIFLFDDVAQLTVCPLG
jgi:hypothetical protein